VIGNVTEDELFVWMKSLANVMGWELSRPDPGPDFPAADTSPTMEKLLKMVTDA
jgi:hypothetical protein